MGLEIEQEAGVEENGWAAKVISLPIPLLHGVSVNGIVKMATTESPNGLPVTVTELEPRGPHPTTKLPLTIPDAGGEIEQMAPESTALPETEQEVSVGENPVPVKVTVLPIPTGPLHGLSVNPTVKLATAESPNELPVTVTGRFELGPTHATTNPPITDPATTEQVAPALTAPPETEQVVSVDENPEPEKETVLPVPLSAGVSVMVWALMLGRSEVAVEMSNTSTMRILLAVLRVEP
ncbi:MAG TPA: hypothetical protein VJZ75_00340 [Candidatus Bathyarchaeia archaeon]|nr:hypothetical protein [Candidatus Bathyarchaeia archaeon]